MTKDAYEAYFKGKHITLMGLGLLGRGVGDACFLAACGATLTVTDLKTEDQLQESVAQLAPYKNVTLHLGGHRLEDFRDCDLILKAAGVPLDSPFIAEATKHAIPVRMSADLFMEISGVPTVGVTGTRGKSTTTHLIAHILQQAGKDILLGGNVQGVSTLALLPEVTADSIAVLELDSWQTQGLAEAKLSPHIAVLTTFMPDHMNYYKNSMEDYFKDKANIFLYQKEKDIFIVGAQAAPYLKMYGYTGEPPFKTITVDEADFPKGWTMILPGEHNRYDASLAIAVARELGIEEGVIKNAVESFEGVPGRLQLIKEIRGIRIYNDTTATVPEATIAALEALDPAHKKNILLIMGGADKGLSMEKLELALEEHCKGVYFLSGTGTSRMRGADKTFDFLEDALQVAMAEAVSGDIIVLSPAFASFGMFKNEYDRGEQFNAAVASLT